MTSRLLLFLIWAHFFSDFILQSDKMALNKSKSVKWLSIHILTYMLPFFALFGWKFTLVNGAAHWVADFVTSRISSAFWKAEERHWFFVTIGADQALHLTVLILTASYLL